MTTAAAAISLAYMSGILIGASIAGHSALLLPGGLLALLEIFYYRRFVRPNEKDA